MTVATYNFQPPPIHHASSSILQPLQRRSQSHTTLAKPSRSTMGSSCSQRRTSTKTELPATTRTELPSKHVWIVIGPAGSGKTTIAEELARKLGLQYVEGDDFHSEEAVHKMKVLHQPLTDADRWSWLLRIREHALDICRGLNPVPPRAANPYPRSEAASPEAIQSDDDDAQSNLPQNPLRLEINHEQASSLTTAAPSTLLETSAGAVVTCSALKLRYRDEFRIGTLPIHTENKFKLHLYFVFLSLEPDELRRRVSARANHFMSEQMVASQIADLEKPSSVEIGEDVIHVDASGSKDEVMRLVLAGVESKLQREKEQCLLP